MIDVGSTGLTRETLPVALGGLVRLIDPHLELEWTVHNNWAALMGDDRFRTRRIVGQGSVVAASRVLSLARKSPQIDSEVRRAAHATKRYWAIFSSTEVRRLHGAAWAYTRGEVDPPMAPSQILSVLEVLEAAHALPHDLALEASGYVLNQLRNGPAGHRDGFASWAPFSPLAQLIVSNLEG